MTAAEGPTALECRPRAFLSYSHAAPGHTTLAYELARALRTHGVEVELDQFDIRPVQGWPRWCEQHMSPERVTFVLVLCSRSYLERVEGRVPADEGRGVYWEGSLMYQEIYEKKGNDRFLPILLDGVRDDDIPRPLRGANRYRVQRFGFDDPGYQSLYQALLGGSAKGRPPVGSLVTLGSLPRQEIRTTFVEDVSITRVTDLEAQGADLHDALRVYERIPDEERVENDELIDLTRRHLAHEFGQRWEQFFLIAKTGDEIAGVLVAYDDVAANYTFVSALAVRQPRSGVRAAHAVSRKLLEALSRFRRDTGDPGRRLRIVAEVDDPKDAANLDEARRRRARLRWFAEIAELANTSLRVLDLAFLQPNLRGRYADVPRRLLLLYAERQLPAEWTREELRPLLDWVYYQIYGDDMLVPAEERAALRNHVCELSSRVDGSLPERIRLRRIRDVLPRG